MNNLQKKDKNGLTEAEFLKTYSADKYPKPSLTADIIIISKKSAKPRVLLIKRGGHPYIDCWAFPGGFAEPGEAIEQTAARELSEETGLEGLTLIPVGFFSTPGRDPRGWVVTQTFMSLVPQELNAKAGDDARDARWFELEHSAGAIKLTCGDDVIELEYSDKEPAKVIYKSQQRLAFDHGEMLIKALKLVN